MIEAMIDIETLGTRPGSLVLSIGSVVFETLARDGTLEWVEHNKILRKPSVIEQIMLEREINVHTVRWWNKQDINAQQESLDRVRQGVGFCFNSLLTQFETYGVTKVWAKPPSFDCVILEELAEVSGNKVPWTHWNRFDVRTVINEASYSTKDHVLDPSLQGGLAHTPVHDCLVQIDILTAARNKIARRVNSS